MNHECPAPGCTQQVPQNKLACPRDWYRIPKPLRNAVWHAYYGNGMGSSEHLAAIALAVRWLKENTTVTQGE